MDRVLKKGSALLLAMIYIFFACLYVVAYQRTQDFPGSLVKYVTASYDASKSDSTAGKLITRPRIVLNKKLVLVPAGIFVFATCVFTWLASFFSLYRTSVPLTGSWHSKKSLLIICSWRI